jgi:hypothetical protein
MMSLLAASRITEDAVGSFMDNAGSVQREKGWSVAAVLLTAVASSLLSVFVVLLALYYFGIVGVPQASAPKEDRSSVSPSAQPSSVPPSQPASAAPIVTNFRICLGEYERACPPHDVYLYCYEDVGKWAQNHCEQSKAITLGSQSGNKCGYTSVQLICTGPK